MTILFFTSIFLFFTALYLRRFFPHLCAICFALSSAWIIVFLYILIKERVGFNEADMVAIGIFMGGSAVGSMYYLFSNLKEEKQLLKLPYILTLFTLIHMLLIREYFWLMIISNLVLWLIFYSLYFIKNKGYFQKIIREIIECCKNW